MVDSASVDDVNGAEVDVSTADDDAAALVGAVVETTSLVMMRGTGELLAGSTAVVTLVVD